MYKGFTAEKNQDEEQQRKAKPYNVKHDYYKPTRCATIAQEESSATPLGVVNVNEDSDDPDAYGGEQKEIVKEMDELRAARHWINQEGWNAALEGVAMSPALGKDIDLRLNWDDVRRELAPGAEPAVDAAPARAHRETILRD